MSAPTPVNIGTGLYILAASTAIIWAWAFQRGGYITKDSFHYLVAVALLLDASMASSYKAGVEE
eukprot:gene7279-7855_t